MMPQSSRAVPVSLGSSTSQVIEVGAFQVTHARFPANETIPPHAHDRACIAVMLEGSFDLRFPGRTTLDCVPGTLSIEPVGDTHCNCIGCAGADVVVIQPDPGSEELLSPVRSFLDGIRHVRNGAIESLARRLAREVDARDSLSPLMVEALCVELLVTAARAQDAQQKNAGAGSATLRRAEEILRSSFRSPPSLTALARECGVHPSHLTRAFRERHGRSIGAFVRGLRVEWVADRLVKTADPITRIALDAGFTDQSHLTRRFREQMGTTPERYRRSRVGQSN